MPLIRYRVGDRGSLPVTGGVCGCGRTLPLLNSVDGRRDDVLYMANGRRIGRLDPVFKSKLPIREAQVIQEALNRVRVRYVPAADYSIAAGNSLVSQMRAYLGDVEVILEPVNEVPRTSNGKFRAVICNLPTEMRNSLEGRVT